MERHFIGYQVGHKHQITKDELLKLPPNDITFLLNSISECSFKKSMTNYESYNKIYKGLGRFRFGNYRIYTLHIGTNYYLILYIYKKLQQKLPEQVIEKILNRIGYYEQNLKKYYTDKYLKE